MLSYHQAETMSAKGSFSFINDKILQTHVGDGVQLRMERLGPAVARVFFVNEGFMEVKVPDGFAITDHSNGDIDVVKPVGREEYFLGWTDNYSMKLNGIVVMKLINQRQWAIQGATEREIMSLEN
jgi:hypothetical protein